MGLFKTLVDSGGETVKTSDIPALVQFFAGSSSPILGDLPSFAPMHYTAIQTDAPANSESSSKPLSVKKQQSMILPDLGVWSVRCVDTMVDSLVPTQHNVFVWTIDLSSSTTAFGQVEPAINSQQQALIRHLIQHPRNTKEEENSPDTATTSLHLLQTAQFGLAPEDKSMPTPATATDGDNSTKTNCVCLQLCVLLPPESDAETQQKIAYVNYHLRKFCAHLQASLVFVSPNEPTETLATITITDLPYIWKALAVGKAVWKYTSMEHVQEEKEAEDAVVVQNDEDATEGATATTEDALLLYGPDTQTDLIDTVWLRNASAPGYWDATTDSIWKVFPPPTTSSSSADPVIPPGDAAWLDELRASMASVTTTTTAAATPVKDSKGDGAVSATPNDKAVSSFFEGLLK